MEKRVILAVVLSIAIIMAFQYIAPRPAVAPKPAATEAVLPSEAAKEAVSAAIAAPTSSVAEEESSAETDRYLLTFSNIGGAIKTIQLKDYKAAGSNEPLGLVQINNPEDYIFAINGQGAGLASLNGVPYTLQRKDGTIIYSLWTKDFEIRKTYVLSNYNRSIELQLFVKNRSNEPKRFDYRVIGGAGVTEPSAQDKHLIEVMSKVDAKIINFKRPKKFGTITNQGPVNWAALKTKYFSIILKPFGNTTGQFHSEDRNGSLVMGIESSATIQPGASIEEKFMLYVGPSQTRILKEAGYDFEETINYGFFGGISKIIIAILAFFYNIIHSWGISIILLSIFLNIVLFPLTLKSFRSMQKMQELHPQMEKLKAQHKGNPQKLNKEIMELYKKYKINPFGGCLPMLLQMPIFIALYQALMKSIELRGARFLWINDLSMPDAVKIPVTLPLVGNSINILPIIMVAAMVVQQKLSTKTMGSAITEEQKQQQKIMLIMMPIMFGFIFYNMPSGLVLYWVVNTVLTLVEQTAIFKKA